MKGRKSEKYERKKEKRCERKEKSCIRSNYKTQYIHISKNKKIIIYNKTNYFASKNLVFFEKFHGINSF